MKPEMCFCRSDIRRKMRQVEVAINLDGEFQEAGKIEDKGRAVTIIPVTEDSGTRSSGIAPHPLCDKLCYVAGDFADHSDKKKAAG